MTTAAPATPTPQFPPELLEHVASFLPPQVLGAGWLRAGWAAFETGVRARWRQVSLGDLVAGSGGLRLLNRVAAMLVAGCEDVEAVAGQVAGGVWWLNESGGGQWSAAATKRRRVEVESGDGADARETPIADHQHHQLARLQLNNHSRETDNKHATSSEQDRPGLRQRSMSAPSAFLTPPLSPKTILPLKPLADYGRFVRVLTVHPTTTTHDDDATSPPTTLYIPSSVLTRLVSPLVRCEVVDLSGCFAVDDRLLAQLAQTMPTTLRRLRLSGCEFITDNGLHRIGMACRRLEELRVDRCGPRLSGRGLAVFTSGHLKQVHLSGCSMITGESLVAMCVNNPLIMKLCLSSCVSVDGQSLARALSALPYLEVLNVSNMPQAVDDRLVTDVLVPSCRRLHSLMIEGCHELTDVGLCSLSMLPMLIRLDASLLPSVTDEGLTCFVRGRGAGLDQLVLGRCTALTDVGVHAIARNCPRLTAIYLSGCTAITDYAMVALVGGCARLQVLSIPGCSITDASVDAAARHLSRTLTIAQFSYCHEVSAEAVCRLSYHCPSLCIIQLLACRRIVGSWLMQFSKQCPAHLRDTHAGHYCALRQPNIATLGKLWAEQYESL